jgi:hypothetical protein
MDGARRDEQNSEHAATGEARPPNQGKSDHEKKRLEIVRGRGPTYPASLWRFIGQEERCGAGSGWTRADWPCRRHLTDIVLLPSIHNMIHDTCGMSRTVIVISRVIL